MNFFDRFLKGKKTTYRSGNDVIDIYEWDSERVVKFNGIVYSRLNSKSLYTHEYWDFFLPLGFAFDRPKILMIGLGGGTIAYQLHRLKGPSVSIDVVDIDKEMVNVMKDFLKVDVGVNITIADGAEFVKGKRGCYDIVILDAYVNDKIPVQFFDIGFVSAVSETLSENGIFAFNYIGSSNGHATLKEYLHVLSGYFTIYELNTGFFTANTVIVCTKKMRKDDLLAVINANMQKDKENAFILDAYATMREA